MSYLDYFSNDCLKYIPQSKRATQKVLIVGCDDGGDCQPFLEFLEIHGLDVCDEIGSKLPHEKITYFQESAECMSRPSNYYDLVLSIATMEHIPDIKAAFSEIYRVTKPCGLIYCVAAPLWNSYDGHHQYGIFTEYPWIHLRLSPAEILDYVQTHKQIDDPERLVNFMFSDYFNFVRSSDYVETAAQLDVSYVINNSLWQDGENLLGDEILSELTAKGYNKTELLAVSHSFIAIK